MDHDDERALPMPELATREPDALELLRMWRTLDGMYELVIGDVSCDDPEEWGLLLADLARHIARSFGLDGDDEEEALRLLRLGFATEMARPSCEERGVESLHVEFEESMD